MTDSTSELPTSDELATLGTTPGLADEAFEHDGLITKRHVRASAFAFLRPAAGELLWDVGLGSGAMAIEWCRAAPGASAIGLERKAERAERARRNIERMVPGRVRIVIGEASRALAGLPAPDAVFLGGGVTDGVLDDCWAALKPGGRIVAHGVTLDTETLLAGWYRAHGGSLSRLLVENVEQLGRFLSWTPARAVTQWACVKDR